MPDVPWSGGPPSRSELESWLINVKGLSREEARSIADTYSNQDRGFGDADTLEVWVDEMVSATTARGGDDAASRAGDFSAVQEQASAIAAEQEARSNARAVRGSALANQRSQVIRDQVQGYYDDANRMAAEIANSQALGIRTDESGRPLLDPETQQPVEMTPQDLWDQIRGLSFDMGSLNLPYSNPRGKSRATAINPNATVMGTRFSQRPDQMAQSQRSLDAQAGRYAGQARRLGKGGPGGRARFRGSERPPAGTSNLTPSQALAMLGNMSQDELTRLQQQLVDAGLYGAGEDFQAPSWGVADQTTRQAFIQLFMVAAERDPDAPISRILNDLTAENINRQAPPDYGPGAAGQQDLVPIPDFTPTIMSKETLGSTIDDIAQDLFGEFVPQDRKEALIAKLQERELGIQRTEYERSVANIREQAGAEFAMGQSAGGGGGGGGGAPGAAQGIDAFMAAIGGQESGGNYGARNAGSGAAGKYQIMPGNWGPWATRAGLGPNAPMTPQNQEVVAKRIMLDYYNQFGNWRDVAIAWYGGPGAVGGSRLNAGQGRYPTINQYADQIMSRMGDANASNPAMQSGMVEVGGHQYPAIEQFDPQSEAEAILKAQDPAGWEAHEFANQALQFYQLLGGVAGGA